MLSSNAGRAVWGLFLFGLWIYLSIVLTRFNVNVLWDFIHATREVFRNIGLGQIVADIIQLILGIFVLFGTPSLIAWSLLKLNQKVKGVPNGP